MTEPSPLTVGKAGGSVIGPSGSKAEIPAGALSGNTAIRIAQSAVDSPPLPTGFQSLGPMFEFTPHGTHFDLPVTVTLPFDPAAVPPGKVPVLFKTNAQGQWEPVASASFTTDAVNAQVLGFSWLQVGGFLRNDPVRTWSFRLYPGNGQAPFAMPCGSDNCTQTGGLLEKSARFGPAYFDHPYVMGGLVYPPDLYANGLIASSANGVTYGVFAEAPFAPLDGTDPIGSISQLTQTQSFRKLSPDATLTFTVTSVLIDATDFYPIGAIGATGRPRSRSITGEVALAVRAYRVPGQPFYDVGGTAFISGYGDTWSARQYPDLGAQAPLWHTGDFAFSTLSIVDTRGGISGCPGTGPVLTLRAPRTYTVDISAVPVGEEFTLEFNASAQAFNRKGGGLSIDCMKSSVSAFLRDPLDPGGTTLNYSGLEPTNRPLAPAPVAQLVPPAPCAPGPGPLAEAGLLQFDAATYTIDEFAGAVPTVTVTRTGGKVGAVSAVLTTQDGTAIAGADYLPILATVSFGDGDDEPRLVKVEAIQNRVVAPDKTVNLALSQPGGCAGLGAQTSAVLTIRDDSPDATYTLGGTVAGLLGSGLVLDGPLAPLAVAHDGPFTFPEALLDSLPYNVRVQTQPTNPAQVCSISNGAGSISGASVTNVQVDCITPPTQGGLDPGFGTAGKAFNGDFENSPVAIGLQRNGKIVVVGSSTLSRFNVDGSLDTSFGTGGQSSVAFRVDSSTNAQSLTVQPDDKILVVGTAHVGTQLQMAVARYMPNGVLDTTFGTAGLTTLDPYAVAGPLARNSTARRALVAADGAIYLTGNAGIYVLPNTLNDFALARLHADGTIDMGYSGDGVQMTPVGSRTNYPYAIGIQSDGKAVIAGAVSDSAVIGEAGIGMARFKTNGSLDTDDPIVPGNYGTNGIGYSLVDPSPFLGSSSGGVSTDVDMVMLPDDSLVVAASARALDPVHGTVRRMTLIRVGSGGGVGASGDVVARPIGPGPADDLVHALVRLGSGKFVVVGQVSPTGNLSSTADFAILRFNADLTPDLSFGADGAMLVDFFGGVDSAVGVVEQADGKLLVVGSARNGTRTGIGMVRLQ